MTTSLVTVVEDETRGNFNNPLNLSPSEYNRFLKSLMFVLKWEGGYSNDPNDPGGETKYGISKKYNPDVDVANLTPSQAARIYLERYWEPVAADLFPLPYCTILFDTSVLCGPARAVEFLEQSDGKWRSYFQIRRAYHLDKISRNPRLERYKNGWLNRLNDLEKFYELYEMSSDPSE